MLVSCAVFMEGLEFSSSFWKNFGIKFGRALVYAYRTKRAPPSPRGGSTLRRMNVELGPIEFGAASSWVSTGSTRTLKVT